MSFLRTLILAGNASANARLEAACRHPDRAQREVLARLLSRNTATAFGREHRFAAIDGPRSYADAVPVREYEGFRPYMRRVVAGEKWVLTREPPLAFATTSGTTGEPKFVPITGAFIEDVGAVARLWIRRLVLDHPHAFDHRTLLIVSPAVEGHADSGIPFGAMSGMAYQRVPWMLRRRSAVPYEACLIKDSESRYLATARFALAGRLSGINTPNPSTLVRLAKVIEKHAETLLRAIADGTPGLRADPGRAKVLARLATARGVLLPRDAWPELAFIACWLGGSAGVQARALGALYGPDVPLRDLGLFASEGRLTIPMDDGDPAGVLALNSMFFEFIPEEESESSQPSILLAHELEIGKRYQLVLSGSHGLYRYDLNDVVEVRGFHNRAPKIAFVRKGRDMLNITGEKLHLNHVLAAVASAEGATGVKVWQFRLIPDVEGNRYDLLLEGADDRIDVTAARRLGAAFDEALAEQNCEYAIKRKSGRLGAPRSVVMRPGWSERTTKADIDRSGKRDHQYKWQQMKPTWDDVSRTEIDEGGLC